MGKTLERKREARFVYDGFGFPVILLNVPMVLVRGVWTPDVDYNKLSSLLLEALATKPTRLVGSEVRFIRLSLSMTLQEFANRLGVTHPAVMKWESAGSDPTTMSWSTEKDIRLEILHSTSRNRPKRFFEAFGALSEAKPTTPQEPTSLELGSSIVLERSI